MCTCTSLSSCIRVCVYLHPYPCAGIMQVCTCMTDFLRLGMAAILPFVFEISVWGFLWFAGAVCIVLVYVHMYFQVPLRCALATVSFILHGALYCAPVFVCVHLHAPRYRYSAGTAVRDWFL